MDQVDPCWCRQADQPEVEDLLRSTKLFPLAPHYLGWVTQVMGEMWNAAAVFIILHPRWSHCRCPQQFGFWKCQLFVNPLTNSHLQWRVHSSLGWGVTYTFFFLKCWRDYYISVFLLKKVLSICSWSFLLTFVPLFWEKQYWLSSSPLFFLNPRSF